MNPSTSAFLAALPFAGCEQSAAPSATSSASGAAPSAIASAAATPAPTSSIRRKWFIATGPRLAIIPGEGLGPIRFGATVESIERQMDLPCDQKSPTSCRYITRAIDFTLADGKVVEFTVHRSGRGLGKDTDGTQIQFGLYNGALPPHDLVPSMLATAVVEALGKPKRTKTVRDERGFGTIEVLHYEKLRVEIDRDPDRGEIVGAFILPRR